MSTAETWLSDSLVSRSHLSLEALPPIERARAFVLTAFLRDVAQQLTEQAWIHRKDLPAWQLFLALAKTRELAPLKIVCEWESPELLAQATRLHQAARGALGAEPEMIRFVVEEACKLISAEERMAPSFLTHVIGRTFDELDELMGLNADERGVLDAGERLFAGKGQGTQSSYSAIVHVLDRMRPPQGASFADLGSGYGRVGLVLGLLRADVSFIGYEYVPERNAVATRAAEILQLSPRIQFLTQDLSARDFEIPEADFFYLYDPFHEPTYRRVLARLAEIGRKKPTTVIAYGKARSWFESAHEAGRESGPWHPLATLESDAICIFSSDAHATLAAGR